VPKSYLDSSAIVKRYSKEEGGPAVHALFRAADVGRMNLILSEWNVEEVLGVLQRKARESGQAKDFTRQKQRMHGEVATLSRLSSLEAAPASSKLLRECCPIQERRFLYVADALQIATSEEQACDHFVTGDEDLFQAAKAEGLRALHTVRDRVRIEKLA
jgi:predicted nucleic acid-binding protein